MKTIVVKVGSSIIAPCGKIESSLIAWLIQDIWGAKAFSTYSSSEIVTTFCECSRQYGGHMHPELAVTEIVNELGRPVSAGVVGELVVTPLGVEGGTISTFSDWRYQFHDEGTLHLWSQEPAVRTYTWQEEPNAQG